MTNWDVFARVHEMERPAKPEANSATIVEAANYLIWGSFLNLHNEILRPYLSREIVVILAFLQMIKLSPEEARGVAEKWNILREILHYDVVMLEILDDLSSR